MFKYLILVFSLLGLVSCSENYTHTAVADAAAKTDDFVLASAGNSVLVDSAPDDEFTFIRTESIGGLSLEMTPKQFVELLPCQVEKSEPVLWTSIGKIVQEWNYADCGVKLQLSASDNNTPQKISSISVTAPSMLKSNRNIGIGSDFDEVLEAYNEFADEADNQSGETFTAGSIYGGLLVKFEDTRVVSLFLGAGAE